NWHVLITIHDKLTRIMRIMLIKGGDSERLNSLNPRLDNYYFNKYMMFERLSSSQPRANKY
ncbi:MAG: hypothetical protein L0I34_11410, partial [Lactiplantibacillus plantarum]|nr:hypothetical protein [Lactiplantibacillus plantarum]